MRNCLEIAFEIIGEFSLSLSYFFKSKSRFSRQISRTESARTNGQSGFDSCASMPIDSHTNSTSRIRFAFSFVLPGPSMSSLPASFFFRYLDHQITSGHSCPLPITFLSFFLFLIYLQPHPAFARLLFCLQSRRVFSLTRSSFTLSICASKQTTNASDTLIY